MDYSKCKNQEGALEHAAGYDNHWIDGAADPVPEDLTQLYGALDEWCYQDSFVVIATDAAGNYFAIAGGGCSCGGSRSVHGPVGTMDEAWASLAEYEQDFLCPVDDRG